MMKKFRRVVTGLNKTGQSSVVFDDRPESKFELPSGMRGYLLWTTDRTPASNAGNADAGAQPFPKGLAPVNGTRFCVYEYPPNFVLTLPANPNTKAMRHPGMHITSTIDYLVVVSGEITLVMEDGEVVLQAGDTLIDRGVYHAWENRSSEPAVVAAVIIDAIPLGSEIEKK